jgi:hypothetical protein
MGKNKPVLTFIRGGKKRDNLATLGYVLTALTFALIENRIELGDEMATFLRGLRQSGPSFENDRNLNEAINTVEQMIVSVTAKA